jgi:hypothetical protein
MAYNLSSPNGLLEPCDLENMDGWFARELEQVSAPAEKKVLKAVAEDLDSFVCWADEAILLWPECDRIPPPGKKQKYFSYPEHIRQMARERRIALDTRPNGPAITSYFLAGGKRPGRFGSSNAWSIHHLYSGKFPYVGRQETKHAIKNGCHFARRRVCRYLSEEHFIHNGRFCGICDYFSVGERYSGMLSLLRLKHHNPRRFKQFLARYLAVSDAETANELFRHYFPKYEGENLIYRPNVRFHGYPDDAQIMDDVLFAELRNGFNEYVTNAIPFEKPNVIFTDLDEDEWPAAAKSGVGRHWVVLIDYHD